MDTPVNEKLSSTLSTKENKKIVEAKYHVSEHFDIPCGLDLEDTSVVKWCILLQRAQRISKFVSFSVSIIRSTII